MAIDALAEDLGGGGVFVNNAGTGESALFLDLTLEAWRPQSLKGLE